MPISKKVIVFCIILTAVVLLSGTAAEAVMPHTGIDPMELDLEGLDPIEITAAHPSPPDDHLQDHASMVAFKEYVEEASDGKISVNVSPGGELGDLGELQELAMEGMVEVVLSSDGAISTIYPNIQVVSLPYIFRDVDHALHVFDGQFGQDLFEDMRQHTGLKTIAWFDNGGFRSFTNDVREVRTPEDMEGLTIRVMEIPSHMEFVDQLGADAVNIDWGELYSGLASGVADGQENAIANVMMSRVYEVQDYMTLDRHFFSLTQILANDDWFQGLPEEYQAIVLEGGRRMSEAARRQTRIVREEGQNYLEEQGMEIYEPTPEEIEKFREATQEPVTDYVRDAVDDESWVDRIFEEADQALDELGYEDIGE